MVTVGLRTRGGPVLAPLRGVPQRNGETPACLPSAAVRPAHALFAPAGDRATVERLVTAAGPAYVR